MNNNNNSEILRIEIGCPPGEIRPDYYFSNIIKIICKDQNSAFTVLEKNYIKSLEDQEPILKMFGDWVWEIKLQGYSNYNNFNYNIDIKKEMLKRYFSNELTQYYHGGCIRYASWK